MINVEARASLGNMVIVSAASNKAICTIDMDGATPNFTLNNVLAGVAAGYSMTGGIVSAATAVEAITTGLTTITGFAVTDESNTATKANTAVAVTGRPSGGTLTVYRWKHTNSTTNTLVASTTAGTLSWLAVGTI